MKIIAELTQGQLDNLALLFEEESMEGSSLKVDRVVMLENETLQIFYTESGNPKVKDISKYDY